MITDPPVVAQQPSGGPEPHAASMALFGNYIAASSPVWPGRKAALPLSMRFSPSTRHSLHSPEDLITSGLDNALRIGARRIARQ